MCHYINAASDKMASSSHQIQNGTCALHPSEGWTVKKFLLLNNGFELRYDEVFNGKEQSSDYRNRTLKTADTSGYSFC